MVCGCTGCIFWACCARSWLFTWRICISTELISTRSTIAVPLTAWWQSHRHGFLTFFVENPDSFTDFAIVLPTLVGRRLAAIMAGRSDIFVAKSAGWLVVVGTGHARDTSAARWLFLRQPCRAGWFWLPLRGSLLRPSAAGIARGGIPLRTPLARVPAFSSFTKANSAYAAEGHPCPWPLVWNHPNDAIGFAKRRAGTNGPKEQ